MKPVPYEEFQSFMQAVSNGEVPDFKFVVIEQPIYCQILKLKNEKLIEYIDSEDEYPQDILKAEFARRDDNFKSLYDNYRYMVETVAYINDSPAPDYFEDMDQEVVSLYVKHAANERIAKLIAKYVLPYHLEMTLPHNDCESTPFKI